MGGTRGIGMNQSLMLVMEGAEETTAWIEEGTADQFEPLTPQATPIDALFALKGDLKVAAPIGHREALGGLHAALQDLVPLNLQSHLLVVIAGVELAHLVIEEVLLVLEGLRATNVLQQKVGEGGRNDIPILGGQLDLGLGSVVDDEDRAVQLGDQLRQEMEFGRGTQPKGGYPLGYELEYHLLDGHLEDQGVLSPLTFHSLSISFGGANYSPAWVPHSRAPSAACSWPHRRCLAAWPRSRCCASARQCSCAPRWCRCLEGKQSGLDLHFPKKNSL